MKKRLDIRIVEMGLLPSREKARLAIELGKVTVNGITVNKASHSVSEADQILLISPPLKYVSRGGDKLEKAISAFKISFQGATVLDVGASTGGFTDCALQHGAKRVYALDVGNDQLNPMLRSHPGVVSLEQTHIRDLTPALLDNQKADIVVADVSFISLTRVLPLLPPFIRQHGTLLVLIKPQFEMEQKKRFKGGVISDPEIHRKIIEKVMTSAKSCGFNRKGLIETDIENTGKKNIEYIAWLVNEGIAS